MVNRLRQPLGWQALPQMRRMARLAARLATGRLLHHRRRRSRRIGRRRQRRVRRIHAQPRFQVPIFLFQLAVLRLQYLILGFELAIFGFTPPISFQQLRHDLLKISNPGIPLPTSLANRLQHAQRITHRPKCN